MSPLTRGTLAFVLPSGSASAGGWAVGSLDETPSPAAGEEVEVGFTILQHGVTPAVLESGVGIQVELPGGGTKFFEAVPFGEPGHYVATVAFPEGGTVGWTLMMGWFGPQDLGTITIAAQPAVGWSTWSRWTTIAVAAGLVSYALAQVVARRRVAPPHLARS